MSAAGRGLPGTVRLSDLPRAADAVAVVGTLDLVGGDYDGTTLVLNPYLAATPAALQVQDGGLVAWGAAMRVTLSQDDPAHGPGSNPRGPPPVIGGIGTIANLGVVDSDARAAVISVSAFVNLGTLSLRNAVVPGEQQSFPGLGRLSWTATIAPKLTVSGSAFENDGVVAGAGATLDIDGGTFVNTGTIALGHAAAESPILSPHPHVGTVSLLSTLEVAADVAGFSNTGTIAADLIRFDGLVGLGDLGTLHGRVVFDGTLDLGGGTLESRLLPPGTRFVLAGAVVDGTVIDSDGRIDLSAANARGVSVFTAQPGTVYDLSGPRTVVLSAGTSDLAYSRATTVRGLTLQAGIAGLTSHLVIGAGTLGFAADTLIRDTLAGSRLQVAGGVLRDDGRILLDGSRAEIETLDGSGTITLQHGATLVLGSLAATAGLTVRFGDGSSTLVLPGDASGLGDLGLRVTGLAEGDVLDFAGVSSDPGTVFAQAGAGVADGALRVQGASGDQASLRVGTPNLVLVAGGDATGGTLVTVACFRRGTRIATPAGEVPVEHLRVGERVRTLDGTRRIVWLGRRAYPAALVRAQPQLRPVRFAPHALGPGRPRRTLDLSPLHAVLIDGALVPAAALVNGRTVTRAPIGATAYVHVELTRPDIVLAEGVPAESYVDCDNRAMFDNAGEAPARRRRRAFPARRIEEGWELEAIRRRLAAPQPAPDPASAPGRLCGHLDQAAPDRLEGWALDETQPLCPVELEIVAEGRQLGCLIANRYRIDLDHAGKAGGVCGFTASLPLLDRAALGGLALLRLSDGARLTA